MIEKPILATPRISYCRRSSPTTSDELDRLVAGLGAAERRRANRFRRPTARWQFAASRILLRGLLQDLLGDAAAARLRLTAGPSGAPALIGPGSGRWPFVSLSHSGILAAAAVSSRGRIGIDVEELGRSVDWPRIAAAYFAPEERDRLNGLPREMARRRFFETWTLKEAFAKYHGESILVHLSATVVEETGPPAYFRSSIVDAGRDLCGWVGGIAGDGILACVCATPEGSMPPDVTAVDYQQLFEPAD
jgi:phosphopantetheinyl transferase